MDVFSVRVQRRFGRPWWLAALVLVCLPVAPLWACPFCSAPTMTVSERYARSSVVLIARRCGEEPPTRDHNGRTKFEVQRTLRDVPAHRWKTGEVITVDFPVSKSQPERVMLLATTTEKLAWDLPVPVTDTLLAYVQEAPGREGDPVSRLAHFMRYLEHPEQAIANDAYAEFANAPYDVIVRVSQQIPREKPRTWLNGDIKHAHRFGLYGLLLGLCGNDSDARFLEEKILEQPEEDEDRLGIDGMMAGYLLLRGEAGLEVIEREKLRNKQSIVSETYAALQAVRFLWTYSAGRVPQARLQSAVRLLLDRPQFAELAIVDLARWKDWSVQGRLLAAYGTGEFNEFRGKQAVLRYLYAASRDLDPVSEAKFPDHARQARAALDRLQKQDPKVFEQVQKFEVQ